MNTLSNNTKSVTVLGDANVDLVIKLPDTARGDKKLSQPEIFGGGTGGNTAVTLARLGTPIQFMGSIGDDGYGRWVREDMIREGVGIDYLVTLDDAITPTVIAMLQPDGERHLVIFPPTGSAPMVLTPDHVDAEQIRASAWLHTTGMCLRQTPVRDALLHGMRIARDAGVPVSLDLNLRIELWGYDEDVRETVEQAIALSTVVFGSADEEVIPVTGAGTAEEAARILSDGKRIAVARNGGEGAIACDATGKILHVPAFTVDVINTIGAGDAFDGGFIAAMVDGKSLADAIRWGNAVAALKIAQDGGARTLPSRSQVEALIASRG